MATPCTRDRIRLRIASEQGLTKGQVYRMYFSAVSPSSSPELNIPAFIFKLEKGFCYQVAFFLLYYLYISYQLLHHKE